MDAGSRMSWLRNKIYRALDEEGLQNYVEQVDAKRIVNRMVEGLEPAGGANTNSTDSRGATALHWEVFEGYQYTAMLVVGYHADQSIVDSELQTPVMIACALGDAFLAKQLVVEGACIRHKDRHGRTAMDIAKEGGSSDTISALKAGASDRLVSRISWNGGAAFFFWITVILPESISVIFGTFCVKSANRNFYLADGMWC
nr:palmitoyltransferase putative [Albugo laibachii Nc14]|eukprot:CCA24806.1 palmitoyltransferase putative [Albugo laibachii Nc14]